MTDPAIVRSPYGPEVDGRRLLNEAVGFGRSLRVARLSIDGVETELTGAGNGPVDAFVRALREGAGFDIHVQNYHEHGLGSGEDATAVAYVQLRIGSDRTAYGVGFDVNIVTATLRAVVCAYEETLMTRPQPRSSMPGITARMRRNGPVTFVRR